MDHETVLCIEFGLLALAGTLVLSALLLYTKRVREMQRANLTGGTQKTPGVIFPTQIKVFQELEPKLLPLPSYEEIVLGPPKFQNPKDVKSDVQLDMESSVVTCQPPPPAYDKVVIITN